MPDIPAKDGIIDLDLCQWLKTSGITVLHFLRLLLALTNARSTTYAKEKLDLSRAPLWFNKCLLSMVC